MATETFVPKEDKKKQSWRRTWQKARFAILWIAVGLAISPWFWKFVWFLIEYLPGKIPEF